MEEKNILQGYEIGTWELGPRLYKIVAAATALTILPLLVIGQIDLFSTSACESPFVRNVCQVLDTVYVGTKILAKDSGYVDQDYEGIELKEQNEIIWTNETDSEPQLEYPEGYFLVANRDELAALEAMTDQNSGFQNLIPDPEPLAKATVPPPTPNYRAPLTRNDKDRPKPPVFPKRNKNAVEGDLSDDPIGDLVAGLGNENSSDSKKPKPITKKPETNGSKSGSKESPANPLEEKTARQSNSLEELKINRKPLYDYADVVLDRVTKKQVDLSQQFVVRMNGVVTEEGLLDERLSTFGKSEGDEAMIALAKQGIQSIGVSGWLKYLSDEKANRLDITFGQNNDVLMADVRSDLMDPNKAKTAASGLRGLIQAAILADKNGWKDMKDDEIALLKAATVTNEGRILIIKFNLEKPIAQKMITARLAEYQQKKAEEARKNKNVEKPSGKVKPAVKTATDAK